MRTFLAAVLDPEALAIARAWAERVAEWPGTAVPEPQWHLTFAYFGELSETQLASSEQAFAALERRAAPRYQLDRWCLLPTPERPRVLAVGGVSCADDAFVEAVRGLQRRLGLGTTEARPFLPHVTLRRFASSGTIVLPEEAMPLALTVRHVGLFVSHRTATGTRYTLRSRYVLR